MGVEPKTQPSHLTPLPYPWQTKCLSPVNEAYFHTIWLINEDQVEDKFETAQPGKTACMRENKLCLVFASAKKPH